MAAMLETIGNESSEVRPSHSRAVGELAFRIRGGDLQGRIARVRAAKCTIGAAADCTLRLSEPGVRPLHCVIFRSEAGATVRRWSPDTQLNGRAFSDALLMVGDRLQIGPVELEVIDDAVLTNHRSPQPVALAPNAPAAPAIPVASLAGEIVEQLKRDLDPKQSDSRLQRERKRVRQARQRVKQLKTKLTRLQESSLRLQSESERFQRELEEVQARRLEADRQLQRLTQEGISSNATMDQLRREADDARRRLEREIHSTNEERKRLEQALNDVKTQLAERDNELTQLRNEWNQRLDQWRRERAELQLTLDIQQKRSAEFEQAQQAEVQGRQQEQATWQEERRSLLKSLEERQQTELRLEAALEELRQAVNQEQLATDTERQELHAEREKLQQRAEELGTLQQWCEQVEQQAQQAARDEAAAHNEVLRLQERVAELEALVERRASSEEDQPSGDDELRRQLAAASHARTAAEAEQERLWRELEQTTQELQQARAEFATLRAEHEQLAAELAERDSRLAAQSAELDSLTRHVSELDSRCHELQELLESRAAEPTTGDGTSHQPQIEALEAELLAKTEELIAANGQVEQVRQQLADRDTSWTKREQDLLRQLQCVEKLARSLEENLRCSSDPETAERFQAEKAELEQQLATSQEKLAAAQKQWNEQRELLEEQALSANQQVLTLEEQLGTAQQSLEYSRSQLQQRDELLAQLRDEVREQMAAWQRERDELRQELEQAQLQQQEVGSSSPPALFREETNVPSLEDMSNDHTYSSPSLEHEEPATVAEVESFSSDHIAEPVESDDSAAGSPVSVNDVLARLGAAGIWRDESDDGQNANPSGDEEPMTGDDSGMPAVAQAEYDASADVNDEDSQSPVSWYTNPEPEAIEPEPAAEVDDVAMNSDTSSAESPPADASAPVSEEDDSIEAYMARLLKRVRGDAVADAFVVQHATSEPKSEAADVATDTKVESQPTELVNPEEFVPRSQAPEQSVDLAAMRELAIHSARQAITQSTQRRRRQAALATTGIAVGSVLGSAALFYWGWQTGNTLAYTGAVGTLAGGLFWSVRRIRRAPRTRVNTSTVK